jgi:hypothetical protein
VTHLGAAYYGATNMIPPSAVSRENKKKNGDVSIVDPSGARGSPD